VPILWDEPGSYRVVASASKQWRWLELDFMGCSHAQFSSVNFAPRLNHPDALQWRGKAEHGWSWVYILAVLILSQSQPEEWPSAPMLLILLGYILTVWRLLTFLNKSAIKLRNIRGYPNICEVFCLQVFPKYFHFFKNESCISHVTAWIYRLGKAA